MGALKITAEGLIIVGKLMKAEGVEESLKSFGKDLSEKYFPKTLKWFRPEARAASSLSAEMEKAIADDGLRNLVRQALQRYPVIIGQIATAGEGIKTPEGNIYVRLVPRFLVNEEAVNEISKALDNASRLQELKGGAEARKVFYLQLVNALDQVYRKSKISVSTPQKAGNGRLLIHYDADFNWKPSEKDPNYLGAYVVYWNDEEVLRKNRKEVDKALKQFVTDLSSLSSQEIDTMRQKIKPPSRYRYQPV